MEEQDTFEQEASEGTELEGAKGVNVSRRGFIKAAGLIAMSAGAEAVATACQPLTGPTLPVVQGPPLGTGEKYSEIPTAPTEPPPAGVLQFFTPDEAKTVEAFAARLIPGSPQDPGAREAGVVTFIDNMLTFEKGYAEPTYRAGPFGKSYEGDKPPPEEPNVVWVAKKEMDRYGFQGDQSPQVAYRKGLEQLDSYAQSKFGNKFAGLTEQQQDTIVGELAGGKVKEFKDPSDQSFFKMIRTHTIQGMFADPAYGGNRDMVGWKLVQYPGAQRAYTAVDLQTEGTNLKPQGLAQLPPFHAGRPGQQGVVLPVSGTEQQAQPPKSSALQQLLNFCRLSK